MSRLRDEEQKSKVGGGTTHWNERIFQESLRLDTEGSLYHPNLMEFTLGGLFGLRQHSFREALPDATTSGNENGFLLGYDFTANFFKRKPYPGSVFARRYQALEPRLFQSSVETTTNSYGANWQYLSDKMPTRLQLEYTDVQLRPLAETADDSSRKNLNLRFDTAYKFSQYNVLSLLYEHLGIDEQTMTAEPTRVKYDSDELTLAHRLDFGRRHEHRLDSEFNLFGQRGSLDMERLRWREKLRLKHSEALRSWYEFEGLSQTRGSLAGLPSIRERSYRFAGGVEQRLFESLVSQVSGWGQLQEFESGANIDRYGGEVRFDYSKKNPFGVLRANYGARIERENRQGKQMRAEIRDERQTFRDPEPVVLANPGIETGSIVITALDGVTFHQVDRDYRLRTLGNTVEIERVPTGRIADGQTVLIDYIYRLGGSFELDTVSQNFGVRQDFSFGLSPYYRLRWQDQSIAPRTDSGFVPDDITAHIIGAEYRRGLFDCGAEYEDHFSTVNPFKAARLRAGYTYRFKFAATAALRAAWTDMSYGPPQDRDTQFFTVEGRYRQTITRNFTAEGAALYRNQRDTLTGPQNGLDLSFALEWLVRQMEIRVTGEMKQFDDDFAKNRSSGLYFQIRRRF